MWWGQLHCPYIQLRIFWTWETDFENYHTIIYRIILVIGYNSDTYSIFWRFDTPVYVWMPVTHLLGNNSGKYVTNECDNALVVYRFSIQNVYLIIFNFVTRLRCENKPFRLFYVPLAQFVPWDRHCSFPITLTNMGGRAFTKGTN